MRRRLLLSWLAFAAILLVILEVPLALEMARRERDTALDSLTRETQLLAAATEEVVEGRTSASDLRALRPKDARLVVVGPGDSPPHGPLHDELAAALAGHPRSGRKGDDLYSTAPVGEVLERHGAVVLVRSADHLDDAVRRRVVVLGGVAVEALAAAVVVALVLARSVARPLDRLRRAAASLGAGDLTARVGGASGPSDVVALAETFDEMAARIERLVASQKAFVADASHQLRTPLTALRLRLEALDATPQDALDAALGEADRLSHLVDGLLLLARADARRPVAERVDVNAVLAERADHWSALATEQGVELRIDEAPGAYASVPAGVLEQVVDNYLDNALEVAPHGSAVTLRTTRRGDVVEVVVADAGPGLSAEDRERAFDRFWRGGTGGDGVGLGLAIVGQLALSAGGAAWLRPRPGGGTEAGVTLPAG